MSAQAGISILMPVRNAGQYLAPAVDSILKQTHTQFELILVDDHSNDGAIAQLKSSISDCRLRFLQADQAGIIAALNQALTASTMPYIARMDADDIAHPARFETQLTYLAQHPDIDIVGSRVEIFRDNGELAQGYQLYETWINALTHHDDIERAFFIESPLPHPTVLMPRDVILQLEGYQDRGWPEDYDLWCRALLAGYRFGKPDHTALLRWRDHAPRASRTQTRYDQRKFIHCKAHYLRQYLKVKGINECVIWGTGPTGLALHDTLVNDEFHVREFLDIHPKFHDRTKRQKRIQVIDTESTSDKLNSLELPFCVVAVGARGARQQLRTWFNEAGWQEGQHYLFAA